MVQFNFYVHGVPIGHEVCPRDAEEDYLKDLKFRILIKT